MRMGHALCVVNAYPTQGTNAAPPLLGRSAADPHFMLDTGRMPAPVPYANEIHKTPAFDESQIDAVVTRTARRH